MKPCRHHENGGAGLSPQCALTLHAIYRHCPATGVQDAGNVIVTVGNTKGGVGKTTLALQLALARRLAGHDVLLVDADRQGSAQMAVAIRSEAGRQPELSCVQYAEGKLLRAQVGPLAAKHDDTIIDAGGRDSEALRVALGRSDVLLVPGQPRAVDVWSLADIAELVEQVQAAREDDDRPPLKALAVLNLADPGANPDNMDAVTALGQFPQLMAIDAPIRRRKAVANAMAHGLSVFELTPRDPKAAEEFTALCDRIFDGKEQANGNNLACQAQQT
jgi:chromosome partitioning protein